MAHQLMTHLNADWQRAVENVRQAANRIWARPLHRSCTDHNVTHSERIIAVLGGLTSGIMTTDKHLSPAEVLVLLSAAYQRQSTIRWSSAARLCAPPSLNWNGGLVAMSAA